MVSNIRKEAEIGFKAAETPGWDFEGGPGSFTAVVVKGFKEAVIDFMEFIGVKVEIAQGRAVAPKAVGDSGDGF